jgi:hypothetical protein
MALLSLCPHARCPLGGSAVTAHPSMSALTGVLLAGSGVSGLVEHLKPLGGLTVYFVDAANEYAVPVLVAVPLGLLVLCALGARWLTRRGTSSGRPFESDASGPSVCQDDRSARAQGWGHS